MAEYDSRTIARFWSKVDRRGPDECWPWTACRFARGYGRFRVGKKYFRANRIAYEIVSGNKLGIRACVCHHCDVPPCCNPAHLFVGTQSDNVSDMIAKGRDVRPRGEAHGGSKLKEAQIVEIRASAEPTSDVSKDFGISKSQVLRIKSRESWRHVR